MKKKKLCIQNKNTAGCIYGKITAICSENHKEHKFRPFGYNAEWVIVSACNGSH